MPGDSQEGNTPSDAAFELKLVFLRELEEAYRQAREAQDRILSSGGDPKALLDLKSFFHRIAGTAHAVDFVELGYLCAVCERNDHKYFKMRLDQEIARARRYKLELALGILDIDHFKHVNDAHGHPAGDAALVHLANLIALSVRSTDVVARYGGEEFGILLVQAGGPEASIITNRIRERIAQNRFALPSLSAGGETLEVPVTVSIGVAQFSAADNLQAFLERADRALYEAKNNGRNQVRVA